MNTIKVQINHEVSLTTRELGTILFNQIGEEFNLSLENIISFFAIENTNVLPNNSFNTIFIIELPDLELRDVEPKELFFSFLKTVSENPEIVSIIKVHDTILQEKAFRYY